MKQFNSLNLKNSKDGFESHFRQYVAQCEGTNDDGSFTAFVLSATDSNDVSGVDDYFEEVEDDEDSDAYGYITSIGTLTQEEATSTSMKLSNRAYIHRLTATPTVNTNPHSELTTGTETDPFAYNSEATSRYTSTVFMGIMIDTGVSRRLTAGYGQFKALQKADPTVKLDTSTKGQVNVQFGIGNATSIGTVDVASPVGSVQFHIVETDTPFLMSLANMNRLQIYFDNLRNVVVAKNGTNITGEVPVVRRFGHPFLLWNASLHSYLYESLTIDKLDQPCYLTDVELRRLHRRFGHPSIEKLHNLLYRTGHEVERLTIEQLSRFCHYCQKYDKSPGRFRFTLRDDVDFNYNIIVDIMYISDSPLLHIVDKATQFQTGRWLRDISAKHTWDALRACWIDTYLGPPDVVTHDAGKNFISKEFKEYASTMGVRTKGIPVEAHNSIGMVERYHGPIRRAYQIIAVELPDIDRDMALQMAFKAISDTAGPDGLVPTLLVFGAYPRMVESDAPSRTITQRAIAIKKAMAEVQKLRAERQIADALNMRNGPNTDAIHDLPPNSPVLVWREGNTGQSGHWDGPYNLITIEGETCTIKLPSGPTAFRSTVVKPYLSNIDTEKEPPRPSLPETPKEPELPSVQQPVQSVMPIQPIKRGRGRPRKYPLLTAVSDFTVHIQESLGQFTASRQKELNGLLEKGVFKVVKLTDVPSGVRLFNSRFVDEVKHPGTDKAYEKSRLVVQAYNDHEKELVLTQSPTIQRISQRLILCIAAMGKHDLYLRDISQAYVQSATTLNRDFYVRPPRKL